MASINSLNYLKNINLSSVKETAKRTAALTLLLSTVACSLNDIPQAAWCLVPGCLVPGVLVIISVIKQNSHEDLHIGPRNENGY